ncbi:HNH endonuclease [Rothia sp. ARF10]|nr:HNH endonuclease [Rothia sp. ARF10]
MATRIIRINPKYASHWERAKENGFWDLLENSHQLEPGQTVLFYVTLPRPGQTIPVEARRMTASFVGRAVTTSAAYPLPEGTLHAWSDEDERRGDYVSRVDLTGLTDITPRRIKWADVRAHAGAAGHQGPVVAVDDRRVGWLRNALGLTDPYDTALEGLDANPEELIDVSGLGEDRRELVPRSVVIRRGRKAFRDSLLTAYEGRCAVTGTALEAILEAAHISDYLGRHTDVVPNGLLLRADIHTLFDLKLLTVESHSLRVRVSPAILDQPYRDLDEQALAVVPREPRDLPDRQVLGKHNDACAWLRPSVPATYTGEGDEAQLPLPI